LNSFERLLDIFCCLKLCSRRRAIKREFTMYDAVSSTTSIESNYA
jgi:hypothetical protein